MSNTIYVIVPTTEVTQAMINVSVTGKLDKVRKSLTGDSCVFEVPKEDARPFIDYPWLTLEDVQGILSTEAWDG